MQRKKKIERMNRIRQEKRENIRLWLDIISKTLVLFAAIFAVWKYSDTRTKEYQKPLWEAQTRLYFEVTSIAARLTNEFDLNNWERDKKRFYELYWGQMILVEDEDVEKAMVEFGKRLYDFDQLTNTEEMQKSMKNLRVYAHKLSYACRASINRGITSTAPTMHLRKDLNK